MQGKVVKRRTRRAVEGAALEPLEPSQLDALDRRLIGLLTEDGRRPLLDLARLLGVSEATARSRLRRLEETRTVRVVAIRNIFATDNELMLQVAVEVTDRPPADVAAELAQWPEVLSAILVSGPHQVELMVAVAHSSALQELLDNWLSRIRGIRRLMPAITLEVCKYETNWATYS